MPLDADFDNMIQKVNASDSGIWYLVSLKQCCPSSVEHCLCCDPTPNIKRNSLSLTKMLFGLPRAVAHRGKDDSRDACL